MNFDPDETALLVVDMQNDFCHPDGALYTPASEAAIAPINTLIDWAREVGIRVGFTQDSHEEDQFEGNHYYDEFDRWGDHAVWGEWGWEIHDDVHTQVGDLALKKPTYDAFHETPFHQWFESVNDLIIVGTLANVCVLHTAASAALRDLRPVVVRDCVGYIEEEHKEYALEHIDFLFGEVVDSYEIAVV